VGRIVTIPSARPPGSLIVTPSAAAARALGVSPSVAGGGGAGFTHDPGGGTLVVQKAYASSNMDTDDSANVGNWYFSEDTPLLGTSNGGEAVSPTSYYRNEFVNGQQNGGADNGGCIQSMIPPTDIVDLYWGAELHLSSNWASPLAILKMFWFLQGAGAVHIPKIDSTRTFQYTSEGGSDTFNTGSDGSPNSSFLLPLNEWFVIEGRVTHQSGSTWRYQAWLNDNEESFDCTMGANSGAINELQHQPYCGGVGTYSGSSVEIQYGHWRARKIA
jgi:hypothetical protein